MSQFHFDPSTYLDLMRAEAPAYRRPQEELAQPTVGVDARSALDLGAGHRRNPRCRPERHAVRCALGMDLSDGMLAVARERPAGRPLELVVADLADELPDRAFDLVVSALAVLPSMARPRLISSVVPAPCSTPGGRFVLADVVVPEDPADAVTPLTPEHDRPSSLADQLAWLADAGLVPAVGWTERDRAVIRADRPS